MLDGASQSSHILVAWGVSRSGLGPTVGSTIHRGGVQFHDECVRSQRLLPQKKLTKKRAHVTSVFFGGCSLARSTRTILSSYACNRSSSSARSADVLIRLELDVLKSWMYHGVLMCLLVLSWIC